MTIEDAQNVLNRAQEAGYFAEVYNQAKKFNSLEYRRRMLEVANELLGTHSFNLLVTGTGGIWVSRFLK